MKNRYSIDGDITKIEIKRKGEVAHTIIDTCDLEKVISFGNVTWDWEKRRYARTKRFSDGKSKTIYLHRLLMDFPENDVDHKNRNKLDNRRSCNLRVVTRQENIWNKESNNICFHKASGLWRAIIYVDGKSLTLYFKTKKEAIEEAKKMKKEFHKFEG
jgi:hypothetical protein